MLSHCSAHRVILLLRSNRVGLGGASRHRFVSTRPRSLRCGQASGKIAPAQPSRVDIAQRKRIPDLARAVKTSAEIEQGRVLRGHGYVSHFTHEYRMGWCFEFLRQHAVEGG